MKTDHVNEQFDHIETTIFILRHNGVFAYVLLDPEGPDIVKQTLKLKIKVYFGPKVYKYKI